MMYIQTALYCIAYVYCVIIIECTTDDHCGPADVAESASPMGYRVKANGALSDRHITYVQNAPAIESCNGYVVGNRALCDS